MPFGWPKQQPDGVVVGCIIYIDAFGNAITNISREDLQRAARRRVISSVRVGSYDLGPVRKCYAEVPEGQPLALIGSAELLEIAVNRGSAREKLGLSVGQEVTVQ